jgi:acyl CoA:acetate/3-ketoacid CoA transferase alpha subunit
MDVLLDGEVIARLKAGQYVTFFVNPGVHNIGIPNQSIATALERGRKHYFMIQTESSQFGFEIERISEKKASARMAQYESIN